MPLLIDGFKYAYSAYILLEMPDTLYIVGDMNSLL